MICLCNANSNWISWECKFSPIFSKSIQFLQVFSKSYDEKREKLNQTRKKINQTFGKNVDFLVNVLPFESYFLLYIR